MQDIEWKAPSPGTWEFDASHVTEPAGRYFDDLYVDAYAAGFARGFAGVGAALETIEMRSINGWHYFCARPLGGPPEPKGPPPKLLMSILFALVPKLRARKKRASTLFVERPWRERLRWWTERGERAELAALDALQARTPDALSDEELADLAVRVSDRVRHQVDLHFENAPYMAVALGDFLVHAERWAGASAEQAMRALAGFSSATQAPLRMMDAVIAALAEDDALDVLDGAAEDMRAEIARRSRAAGKALDAYLDAYGLHAVSGITVYDASLIECPDVWIGALRGRASGREEAGAARQGAGRVVETLTASVAEAHRAEWGDIVADAQAMTHLRESDVSILMRAAGLGRRTMLEVGRRLVARGLADEAHSGLDITAAEAADILRGGGLSGNRIRAFTAERRAQGTLDPPAYVGPPPMAPPVDRMPAAIARVTEAAMAFTSRFRADADPIVGEGLAGHGVSGGVIEGTARHVRGPEDFATVGRGDIIVTRTTAPSFNVVLAMAAGVVTEVGGLICHAAIVAREFGIPGIVGCAGAMDQIPAGARIRIDGDAGTVEVLDEEGEEAPAVVGGVAAAPTVVPRVPAVMGTLVPLAEAGERARFGGKASALATLETGAIRVPGGFVLDAGFAEAVAARDPVHIDALNTALRGLPGPWAVRSSATSEDGATASFAGQFATVLGVCDGEACVAAVHDVWASANTAGVTAYRQRLGLTEDPQMAVIVQRLVDASVAGVLFTGEGGEHLIEACWGLGEPLVSGMIEPDRFTLGPDGAVRSRAIADKPTELVRAPGGVTETRPVDESRIAAPCLQPQQLTALAELAARVNALFGARQDVEFAFDRDGDLICLQSRPITTATPVLAAAR